MQSPVSSSLGHPAMRMPLTQAATNRRRLQSLDALRGFVMVIMLIDHIRENWYLHLAVADPVNPLAVDPALFFMRIVTNLCAPIFVGLTGLGAYLYGLNHTKSETASYLLKRGLLLMAIDVTLLTFAWTVKLPVTVWLQVIWAIGVCMIALAGLIHLPKKLLLVLGLLIVGGHNLLDGVRLMPGEPGFVAWALLHQRDLIALPFGAVARTSYPVLPWIGVIALGYAIGPWFAADVPAAVRTRRLRLCGMAALVAFAVIRGLNGYGDPHPWQVGEAPLATVMSLLNVTKYPPSLDFLLLTLGVGALLLAAWPERAGRWLAVLGGAPLFFYILHLYVLHIVRIVAARAAGVATADLPDVPSVAWLWLIAAVLTPPLWLATRWFAARKRASGARWMRYL